MLCTGIPELKERFISKLYFLNNLKFYSKIGFLDTSLALKMKDRALLAVTRSRFFDLTQANR